MVRGTGTLISCSANNIFPFFFTRAYAREEKNSFFRPKLGAKKPKIYVAGRFLSCIDSLKVFLKTNQSSKRRLFGCLNRYLDLKKYSKSLQGEPVELHGQNPGNG